MRLGYTSAHSRLQLDAALSCAALRGLHQLSQHFRFSLFSFSELVNWRRVVFTSGRLGAACATSHSSHFIYSFLQIYMSLIRLSPHRDARPRHISKYECARVCVLLLYRCDYIYSWQRVIWLLLLLLLLLPIVFWVAALGSSEPWGLQHAASVGICGVFCDGINKAN